MVGLLRMADAIEKYFERRARKHGSAFRWTFDWRMFHVAKQATVEIDGIPLDVRLATFSQRQLFGGSVQFVAVRISAALPTAWRSLVLRPRGFLQLRIMGRRVLDAEFDAVVWTQGRAPDGLAALPAARTSLVKLFKKMNTNSAWLRWSRTALSGYIKTSPGNVAQAKELAKIVSSLARTTSKPSNTEAAQLPQAYVVRQSDDDDDDD